MRKFLSSRVFKEAPKSLMQKNKKGVLIQVTTINWLRNWLKIYLSPETLISDIVAKNSPIPYVHLEPLSAGKPCEVIELLAKHKCSLSKAT